MAVRLDAGVDEALRGHAQESFPQEACGMLLGEFHEDGVRVHRTRRAPNAAGQDRGTEFAIHPRDLIAAEDEALQAGLEIVGFYHSHPNVPAAPSQRDHSESWPLYAYAIVSVLRGEARHVTFWRRGAAARLVEEKAI